jgi:hypothetical protein
MAEPKIPDRSNEPALQASLDHGPKSTTASNSNDVPPDAPADARDDEGNSTATERPLDETAPAPKGSRADSDREAPTG